MSTTVLLHTLNLFLFKCVDCNPGKHFEDATENNKENNIFEGDLRIPPELILRHYDLKSVRGGKQVFAKLVNDSRNVARAVAASRAMNLWSNKVIWYKISPNFTTYASDEIHRAMKHWENHTCLRFLPVRENSDFIYFTNTDWGCYSSYVGKQGGMQVINIGYNCVRFGHIVHEIAHAIGFWHEQTRPDRDSYVWINTEIIPEETIINFMKRKYVDIDYQGSPYDYGSIMHYPTDAFSNRFCIGSECDTISINNLSEYNRQGRPTLGQLKSLSLEDIKQANRLYSCPTEGVQGFLSVEVKRGYFPPGTESFWEKPDSYVLITAVDSNGTQHTLQTSHKQSSQPVWDEIILFGEQEWQFFKIRAWNYDVGTDNQLTMSQTVPLEHVSHRDLKHCNNEICTRYVTFGYVIDTNTSKNATLKLYIRSAYNLVDTDPVWNNPDPYVCVEAVQSNAVKQTQTTRTVSETVTPTWNQWLDYGCQKWNSFLIQIHDEDTGIDNKMSDKQWVHVHPGLHSDLTHIAHGSGYLTFEYSLIVDGNDCISDLCQNGGTCIDECASYACNCLYGYIGSNCQYSAGNLNVAALYGRGLTDEEVQNDVNYYMEFIAVDAFGQSERKATKNIQGNRHFSWNEIIKFNFNAWRQLSVRVFYAGNNTDIALSNQQMFSLSNYGTRSNIRHDCYNGYVIFDYSYY